MYEITEGADVLYRLKERNGQIVDRPAKIVRVWRGADQNPQANGLVNLAVFVDGANDVNGLSGAPVIWATSIEYSTNTDRASTWHWPA